MIPSDTVTPSAPPSEDREARLTTRSMLGHEQVIVVDSDGDTVLLDRGVLPYVMTLWRHGVVTWYSCEGRPEIILPIGQWKKAAYILGWRRLPWPNAYPGRAAIGPW